MTRVTSIDSGQVITTGLVNMRRFEQRPTETLVLGELLDRTVDLLEDGSPVIVEDVAMEQQRTRDWAGHHGVRAPARQGAAPPRRGADRRLARRRPASASPRRARAPPTCSRRSRSSTPADLATVLHELSAEAPRRGRRRARRREARRRPRGAARGRPGRDPRQARGGARRRRPRGDAARRRRRPARRAAAGRGREAARADGARRGRAAAPPAGLLRRHRRRHDDDRAGRSCRRTPPSPRRWPGSASPSCPRRWPPRSTSAGRRWRPRPAGTSASRTSSGCCASRRSALVSGVVDSDIEPLAARRAAGARSRTTWRRTTWSRHRSSTTTTTCSARSPSTTCSTTCCPSDWRGTGDRAERSRPGTRSRCRRLRH